MVRMGIMEMLVLVLVLVTAGESVRVMKQQRKLAPDMAGKIRTVLVFGDSTVDPGNNDILNTTLKANFLPYGIDFMGGYPTGRHSNGFLPTDFFAQKFGIADAIPAFLDPKLTPKQLPRGVSFASAGAGFDELTCSSQNVLSIYKQIELLEQYKAKLSRSAGSRRAKSTMESAVVIVSAGTNDFIQNYYVSPVRSKQFTVSEYVEFLIARLSMHVETIHTLGPRAFVVTELGTVGCLPIVRTLLGNGSCFTPLNAVAALYNSKLHVAVAEWKRRLGIAVAIGAFYQFMAEAVADPAMFEFVEVKKGCCGSGLTEFGETCKGKKLCSDRSSYLFFDAIHPSERIYKIFATKMADSLMNEVMYNLH